ncbi:hypothetical protein B0H19DRAFT_944591 [Mycena capillaripes]|nr:hypothetical protein B0H19DRAFT_944591 [Mycena capillaripes]
MACGAINKGDPGKNCLFRILISEYAYLIWLLQNQRVINERDSVSHQEIKNRWCWIINNRISLDSLMSNKVKYGNKSLNNSECGVLCSQCLVLKPWRGTLLDEDRLPDD